MLLIHVLSRQQFPQTPGPSKFLPLNCDISAGIYDTAESPILDISP